MGDHSGEYQPLVVRPIIRDQAVEFLRQHHRHNKRSLPGWKFGSGIFVDGQLAGVGIAGRPSARVLDQRGGGHFIEITRVGTNGVRNGCSRLYGRLLRAARALGYCRAYTYTLDEESGASLKASGWTVDEVLAPRSGWDAKSRPRDEQDWPDQAKVRWIQHLDPTCPTHAPAAYIGSNEPPTTPDALLLPDASDSRERRLVDPPLPATSRGAL